MQLGMVECDARIKGYVALHRTLANETGEIDETKSSRQITDREVALGKLIRTARAQVRRGDIFTPSAEALFKQLIREESARRSPRVRTDRKENQHELSFQAITRSGTTIDRGVITRTRR